MRATEWDAAVEFFTEHAGLSYLPPQTPEEGQRIVARKLAASEMAISEVDWRVTWSEDWEVGDHFKEFGEAYADGEPETCEVATLTNRRDDVIGSLGCVDDASVEYRRVVAAELAEVALTDSGIGFATCGTCDRMFPDLYPSARCPFEYAHDLEDEDEDEDVPRTDHSADIAMLRGRAEWHAGFGGPPQTRLMFETAADLLELHDSTGISLDDWTSARELIEYLTGNPITRNGV
jgi:hypothetical protein